MKRTMLVCKMVAMACLLLGVGCKSGTESNVAAVATKSVSAPEFSADSAYLFVKAQCDFGARVPGTTAHSKCGDYLVEVLKQYGAEVIEQTAPVTTFDGHKHQLRNIIGQWNVAAERRVLLLAHYDSRPWADSDPDESKHSEPVMGANDGASGVGVLLEVGRLLNERQPTVGVDILLVDLEDWGDDSGGNEESWALGTQYWASHPHRPGYKPLFGILLDMVGAADARFYREYYSSRYAPQVVSEVWRAASRAGYGAYFPQRDGSAATDDHTFVNRIGIPCIDIIDMRPQSTNGFFPHWHTTHDTIDVISPTTLKAVGQTVVNYLFEL